jgi:hypothetical protein
MGFLMGSFSVMRGRARRRRLRTGCGCSILFFDNLVVERLFSHRYRAAIALAFGVRRGVGNVLAVKAPQADRHVLVDRAGVSFLLGHAQFREPIENLVSLHFQLTSQLIDTNLLHRIKRIYFTSR